jgi:hypothetical protein
MLSAASVTPGGRLGISSAGWQGPVVATMRSDPVVLGTLTPNAAGVVSAQLAIPSNATPGPHTLELTGTRLGGGARTATVAFTVAGTATSIPRTGSDSTDLVPLGLVLLGVGCLTSAAASARKLRRET